MRIAVIGDIHGRRRWEVFWKLIKEYDLVVFLGDYMDSHIISINDQILNLRRIIQFKKTYPDKVVLLLGNHDVGYLDPVINRCPGNDMHNLVQIADIFVQDEDLFTYAKEADGFLFTHAGISSTWLDRYNGEYRDLPIEDQVNLIIENKPTALSFYSNQGRTFSNTGDDISQSPVWIRPQSLARVMGHPKQVVGHTFQNYPVLKTDLAQQLILADAPQFFTTLNNGQFGFERF
jgi:hypothetical protein